MSYVAPSHENLLSDSEIFDPSNWDHLSVASSGADTLRTLLDYQGEYKARSEVLPVPAVIPETKKEADTSNLQALMPAPLTCTIPPADLLKLRPNLWGDMAELSKYKEYCTKHNMDQPTLKQWG